MSSNDTLTESTKNVIDCLNILFTAIDKETRNKAENLLKEYQKNPLQFANIVFNILQSDQSEIQINNKLSAIISLNKLIQSNKINFKPNELDAIFNEYLKCILNPQLDDKIIKNINEGFIYFLNAYENIPNYAVNFTLVLFNNTMNAPLESIKGLIVVLFDIINSNLISINNYIAPLEQIIKIIQVIQNKLYLYYTNPEICFDKNKQLFIYLTDCLRELYSLIYKIITKVKKKFKNDEIVISLHIFLLKAIEILFYNTQNKSIISFTGIKEYDLNVNFLKSKILKYINVIIHSLPQNMTQDASEIYIQLGNVILQNLEWLVNNKMEYIISLRSSHENIYDVIEMGENDMNIQLLPNYKYSLIISYFILYLTNIFKNKTLRSNFDNNKLPLFKNIILPLLIISKEEIIEINDREQCDNYSLYIHDIITSNKYKNIKSSVSLLIKTISEHDPQMQTFVIEYSLILIYHSLGKKFPSAQLETNEDKIYVLLKNDNDKQIDIALLLLNIISFNEHYYINNTKSKFNIEMFIDESINILMNGKVPIFIKHKMILIIKFYLPIIKQKESTYIYYLFQNLLPDKDLLLQRESSNILNDFIVKYQHQKENQIIKSIEIHAYQIIQFINCTNMLSLFDIIFELSEKFILNGKAIDVFIKVCERIRIEVERHFRLKFKKKEKNKNAHMSSSHYNLIINKSFNIVRSLLNDATFVTQNIMSIETAIEPLLQYMDNINKIEFDEDLVLIMTSLIKNLKYVPKTAFAFLKYTPKYAEKNKGMLLDLYELINLYITFGMGEIEKNSYYLNYIGQVIKMSFNDTKYKTSPFKACLLLQNWFMNSSTIKQIFTREIIAYIIIKLNNLYQLFSSLNYQRTISDEYNYLAYITLLYSCFINYYSICIEELNKSHWLSCLNEWTTMIFKLNIICQYEFKVLVIVICNLLREEVFLNEYDFLLKIVLELLLMQRKNESNALKKKLQKKINCNFVNEDDEENEDKDDIDVDDNNFSYNYIEYSDEQEVLDLVKNTNNNMKNKDEFKCFKELLETLEKNHSDIVSKWICSLDDVYKIKFKNILQTYRITVIDQGRNFSIPRKIVSIKRSISN